MPTVVLVSSDSRIDRLMSARGQSTFHDPPWLSPPKPPLKMMRQNWNEPSTSAGVESRTLPKPRLKPRRNWASTVVAAMSDRENQQADDGPAPHEAHGASLPLFGRSQAFASPGDSLPPYLACHSLKAAWTLARRRFAIAVPYPRARSRRARGRRHQRAHAKGVCDALPVHVPHPQPRRCRRGSQPARSIATCSDSLSSRPCPTPPPFVFAIAAVGSGGGVPQRARPRARGVSGLQGTADRRHADPVHPCDRRPRRVRRARVRG